MEVNKIEIVPGLRYMVTIVGPGGTERAVYEGLDPIVCKGARDGYLTANGVFAVAVYAKPPGGEWVLGAWFATHQLPSV